MHRLCLAMTLALLLTGCQNQYKQHFRSLSSYDFSAASEEKCKEPEIIQTSINDKTTADYYKQGYVKLGYSRFSDKKDSDSDLVKFAKEIGACLVLKDSKHGRPPENENRVRPQQGPPRYQIPAFPMPNRAQDGFGLNLNPAPSNGDFITRPSRGPAGPGRRPPQDEPPKREFYAEFYAKLNNVMFGALFERLPDDLSLKYSLDKAVLISAVMYGKPADLGGLRSGDVVLSVAGEEVSSQSFYDVLKANQGKSPLFVLIRGGNRLEKIIAY